MEQTDLEQTGVAAEIFDLYTEADEAGREIIGTMFDSLFGKSFDTFLSEAAKACEKTLESSEVGESLDEMLEQKVEVAEDSEIGDEMSVSNGVR